MNKKSILKTVFLLAICLSNQNASGLGLLSPEPVSQPTNLIFPSAGANSITLNFTPATALPDGYLIVSRVRVEPTTSPVDGVTYSNGQQLGDATVIFSGNLLTFNDQNSYQAGYVIYYKIYSYNGNGSDRNYLIINPLMGSLFFSHDPGNYYSLQNGDWENGNSWSMESHTGAPAESGPQGTGSEVFIGNYDSIYMSKDVFISSKTLTIRKGALLDANGFALNVSGILKIDGSIINGGELQTSLCGLSIYSYNKIPVFNNLLIDICPESSVKLFTDIVLFNGIQIVDGRGTFRTNGFKVYPCIPPTKQAGKMSISDRSNDQVTISWERGNGNGTLVVARIRGKILKLPKPGATYVANSNFGLGSKTGTDNYVVYQGSGTSLRVTNLDPGLEYDFDVYEFNSTGKCYNISSLTFPITEVVNPSNGSVGVYVNRKIAAKALVGGLAQSYTYTIELSLTPDFSNGVISKTAVSPSQTFNGLQYNTKYYTRVLTNLSPKYSKINSFTTGTPDLFTYMISPKNLTINQSITPTIKSFEVEGASNYTIELNTTQDFSGTSIIKTGITTQKFIGLSPATTYYVRIKTDLSPVWGPVKSFSTISTSSSSTAGRIVSSTDELSENIYEHEDIDIFPVPFKNKLFVQVTSPKNVTLELVLLDLFGKEILIQKGLTNQILEVDANNVSNGYYFLKLITARGTYFRKVLKD